MIVNMMQHTTVGNWKDEYNTEYKMMRKIETESYKTGMNRLKELTEEQIS